MNAWKLDRLGLQYVTYGMDEKSHGVQRRRFVLEPPAAWKVEIIARPTRVARDGHGQEVTIQAQTVLENAVTALKLLSFFGGVGSKSRKGLGCFRDLTDEPAEAVLEQARDCGRSLRDLVGLPSETRDWTESASIDPAHMVVESVTDIPPNAAPWVVVGKIGYAYRLCVYELFPRELRDFLGLPRSLYLHPEQQGDWHPCRAGRDLRNLRHASPLHIHAGKTHSGNWVVRLTAFPCACLSASFKDNTHSISSCAREARDFFESFTTRFASQIQKELESAADVAPATGSSTGTGIDSAESEGTAQGQTPTGPPPRPQTRPQPVPRPEPREATGLVVEKPGKRKAIVQLDDGTKVTAAGARSFNSGQRVKVREITPGNWEIVGRAD